MNNSACQPGQLSSCTPGNRQNEDPKFQIKKNVYKGLIIYCRNADPEEYFSFFWLNSNKRVAAQIAAVGIDVREPLTGGIRRRILQISYTPGEKPVDTQIFARVCQGIYI